MIIAIILICITMTIYTHTHTHTRARARIYIYKIYSFLKYERNYIINYDNFKTNIVKYQDNK